ncbi:MAG TPA: TlpA disulfide reductase family protein [Fimbriimonadaceae bacterium]|jgi:thiol-disulfide isomerase/thioredoxin
MKKSSIAKMAVAVCAVAALAVSSLAADSTATYKLKDSKTKQTVTLQSMRGKYKAIYIDMFAKWCGPCQLEIPEVIKLHNKFAGKGLAVVGFDVWDKWDAMQEDIKARGINYQVLFDPAPMGEGIAKMYKETGIPVILILDGKTLQIKGKWEGYDASGGYGQQQLKVLKSLGVKA